MRNSKIKFSLPSDLKDRVREVAHARRRSAASLIREALRQSLASGGGAPDLAGGDLGSVNARLDKVIGEARIVKEATLLFIRVWLEYNPPIEEVLEASAAASAEARFDRFLGLVAQALQTGHFIDRGELSQAASAIGAPIEAQAS